MVTDLLQVFSVNVYALLDPSANLSFIAHLVAKKFDVLPDILNEPFLVKTPVGHSVVPERVFMSCPISLPNRVMWVDLIELDVVDFDVILGMDLLHACFASLIVALR